VGHKRQPFGMASGPDRPVGENVQVIHAAVEFDDPLLGQVARLNIACINMNLSSNSGSPLHCFAVGALRDAVGVTDASRDFFELSAVVIKNMENRNLKIIFQHLSPLRGPAVIDGHIELTGTHPENIVRRRQFRAFDGFQIAQLSVAIGKNLHGANACGFKKMTGLTHVDDEEPFAAVGPVI